MKLEMDLYGMDVSISVEDEYQTGSPQLLSATSKFLEVLSQYSKVDIRIETTEVEEDSDSLPPGVYHDDPFEQGLQGEYSCRPVDTNNPAWPFPLDKRP